MPAAPATIRLHLADERATAALGAALAGAARPGDAILLEGDLGAGKTTLARAFVRAASGDPALEVPSPTFTLVQEYGTRLGQVTHYDLWRLEAPAPLGELGWDDAAAGVLLVEWPDRLGPLRPVGALTVALALDAGESRAASLSGWPAGRLELLVAGAAV